MHRSVEARSKESNGLLPIETLQKKKKSNQKKNPTNLTDRAVHKDAKRDEPQRPPRVVREPDDRLRDEVPQQEPDERRRGLDGDRVVCQGGVVGGPGPRGKVVVAVAFGFLAR